MFTCLICRGPLDLTPAYSYQLTIPSATAAGIPVSIQQVRKFFAFCDMTREPQLKPVSDHFVQDQRRGLGSIASSLRAVSVSVGVGPPDNSCLNSAGKPTVLARCYLESRHVAQIRKQATQERDQIYHVHNHPIGQFPSIGYWTTRSRYDYPTHHNNTTSTQPSSVHLIALAVVDRPVVFSAPTRSHQVSRCVSSGEQSLRVALAEIILTAQRGKRAVCVVALPLLEVRGITTSKRGRSALFRLRRSPSLSMLWPLVHALSFPNLASPPVIDRVSPRACACQQTPHPHQQQQQQHLVLLLPAPIPCMNLSTDAMLLVS